MIGLTYIDDLDIFEHFGIFVAKGGYVGLAEYPKLKKPEENDWQEDDGIEVDLLSPKLDSKSFTIKFGVLDFEMIDSLLDLLSDGSYHEFRFNELNITKRLRLVSHSSNKVLIDLGNFSMKFADDFPLEGFVPTVLDDNGKVSGFEIDDLDLFSVFNIQVLEGVRADLSKSPSVKENLIINTSTINGAIYDGESVTFQPKRAKLKCLYFVDIEKDGVWWWQDYYNFLSTLIQPGERQLYVEYQDNEHSCYYVSSKVKKFRIIGKKVWCEFTLSLMLTAYRVGEDLLLAAEDGSIIILEDEICGIDLNSD